jgi:hypothetical protein
MSRMPRTPTAFAPSASAFRMSVPLDEDRHVAHRLADVREHAEDGDGIVDGLAAVVGDHDPASADLLALQGIVDAHNPL